MYEQFKDQFITALSVTFSTEDLRTIGNCLDTVANNYDISKKETDVVVYEQEIPETVEIYKKKKKIAGLSETSLYLYLMVLKDFFYTVRKQIEKSTFPVETCDRKMLTSFILP